MNSDFVIFIAIHFNISTPVSLIARQEVRLMILLCGGVEISLPDILSFHCVWPRGHDFSFLITTITCQGRKHGIDKIT